MRKLVVLMLVLGMASLASAVYMPISAGDISIAYNGTTFTVTGNVAKSVAFGIYDDARLGTGDGGSIVTPDFSTGANLSTNLIGQLVTNGYNGIDISVDPAPAASVVTGPWLTFQYTGPNHTFKVVEESDGSFAREFNITATPEPATLAILGLGGLLLRRKK